MKLKLEGIKYDIGSKELLCGINLNVEKNHFCWINRPKWLRKNYIIKKYI